MLLRLIKLKRSVEVPLPSILYGSGVIYIDAPMGAHRLDPPGFNPSDDIIPVGVDLCKGDHARIIDRLYKSIELEINDPTQALAFYERTFYQLNDGTLVPFKIKMYTPAPIVGIGYKNLELILTENNMATGPITDPRLDVITAFQLGSTLDSISGTDKLLDSVVQSLFQDTRGGAGQIGYDALSFRQVQEDATGLMNVLSAIQSRGKRFDPQTVVDSTIPDMLTQQMRMGVVSDPRTIGHLVSGTYGALPQVALSCSAEMRPLTDDELTVISVMPKKYMGIACALNNSSVVDLKVVYTQEATCSHAPARFIEYQSCPYHSTEENLKVSQLHDLVQLDIEINSLIRSLYVDVATGDLQIDPGLDFVITVEKSFSDIVLVTVNQRHDGSKPLIVFYFDLALLSSVSKGASVQQPALVIDF